MPLKEAGQVRRDLYSDSLLLEVGKDEVYVLAVEDLQRISSRRAGHVTLSRRYEASAPGEFQDFPCAPRLQRAASGYEVVLAVDGIVYAMTITALVKVARGEEDLAKMWRDVPESPADQQQATLGAF
jgi:antitoxin (DNA-binding transcriptional repressor) of toxin-antitoxin stability system